MIRPLWLLMWKRGLGKIAIVDGYQRFNWRDHLGCQGDYYRPV